jgi:hypothetical protein
MIKGDLFYINLALFLIMIINAILITLKYTENFESADENSQTSNSLVKVVTRPCTLHLTNDDDLCEKLADIYKMTELQIQVVMNKMKIEGNKSRYDLMQFVKDNKKTLPINACKVQLNNFREVQNLYNSSNANLFKNISRNTYYDDKNLFGYCLTDITSYSDVGMSNILDILSAKNPPLSSNIFSPLTPENTVINIQDVGNNSRYAAIKIQNRISMNTLLNEAGSICPNVNVALDDGMQFLRFKCTLANEVNLKFNQLEMVSYNKLDRKFDINQGSSNIELDPFFTYRYNNRQIVYGPAQKDILAYKMTYDYCNRLEAFAIFNNLKFSFSELNVMPKIVKYSIDLPNIQTSNVNSVPSMVYSKMNNILLENKIITARLDEYTSNQDILKTEFSKLRLETCPSILTDNNRKAMCVIRAANVEDEYNKLEVEKYYLKELLEKQRQEYNILIDAANKINIAKFTVKDINEIIGMGGMAVAYSKYADIVSNDDYIYVQV